MDFFYGEYRNRESEISGRTITRNTHNLLKTNKYKKSMFMVSYSKKKYILINLCDENTNQMDLAFGVLKIKFKFKKPVKSIKLLEGLTEDKNNEFPLIKINNNKLEIGDDKDNKSLEINIAYARSQSRNINECASIHISRIYDLLNFRIGRYRYCCDKSKQFFRSLQIFLSLDQIDITNIANPKSLKFYIANRFIKFSDCAYLFEVQYRDNEIEKKGIRLRFNYEDGDSEKSRNGFLCTDLNKEEYDELSSENTKYKKITTKLSGSSELPLIIEPFE